MIINGSICVTDIPKEKITTSQNGKKYLNVAIFSRKSTDKQGNDMAIAISQTKAEREAKAPTIFIGGAKTFNPPTPSPEKSYQQKSYSVSDAEGPDLLPFNDSEPLPF